MKELTFKRETNRRPVKLEDKDGNVQEYELRELKSNVRDQFLDRFTSRLQTDNKGNVTGIKPGKYEGMQAELLVLGLYDPVTSKLVDKKFVDDLPSTAVTELFKAGQVLNGMRQADEYNEFLAKRLADWLAKEKGIVGLDASELEAFIDQAEIEIKNSGDAKEAQKETTA